MFVWNKNGLIGNSIGTSSSIRDANIAGNKCNHHSNYENDDVCTKTNPIAVLARQKSIIRTEKTTTLFSPLSKQDSEMYYNPFPKTLAAQAAVRSGDTNSNNNNKNRNTNVDKNNDNSNIYSGSNTLPRNTLMILTNSNSNDSIDTMSLGLESDSSDGFIYCHD